VAQQYIYFIEPSRPELLTAPGVWTEEELQIGRDHVAHLKRATECGQLILAGRCQDGAGPGIVIFEAEDDAAARAFMESDPFVASGLMRGRLHPYKVALQRAAD